MVVQVEYDTLRMTKSVEGHAGLVIDLAPHDLYAESKLYSPARVKPENFA